MRLKPIHFNFQIYPPWILGRYCCFKVENSRDFHSAAVFLPLSYSTSCELKIHLSISLSFLCFSFLSCILLLLFSVSIIFTSCLILFKNNFLLFLLLFLFVYSIKRRKKAFNFLIFSEKINWRVHIIFVITAVWCGVNDYDICISLSQEVKAHFNL